jgi:hypothetical protein
VGAEDERQRVKQTDSARTRSLLGKHEQQGCDRRTERNCDRQCRREPIMWKTPRLSRAA